MAFQHARFTRPTGRPAKPWALTPRFHHHPPNLIGRVPTKGRDEGCNFLWHCLFPPLQERPGSSPVHCPMLSRLSSPSFKKAIARFVVNRKGNEFNIENRSP